MAPRKKGYSWLIKNNIDEKYRSGMIIVRCKQGQHAAGTKLNSNYYHQEGGLF